METAAFITMKSGEQRLLPSDSDASGLLRLGYRDFGDSYERLSILARGLWACTATRKSFESWFLARRASFGLQVGRDFFVACDGLEEDFYVDAPVVPFLGRRRALRRSVLRLVLSTMLSGVSGGRRFG